MKYVRMTDDGIVREIIHGELPPLHPDVAKLFIAVEDDEPVKAWDQFHPDKIAFGPIVYKHTQDEVVRFIKALAQDKINLIMDDVKQRNSLAKMALFNGKKATTKSEEDEFAVEAAKWAQIEQIRDISNQMEQEYLNTGVVTTEWPEWSASLPHTLKQFIDGEI